MKTIWDYLDDAMKAVHAPTLNALAKHLGCTRNTVYNWAKGRHIPTNQQMLVLAELTSSDPRIALIERAIWQAATERDRELMDQYLGILEAITGKQPKLPDAYDIEKGRRYKFRTPDTLVST